MFHKYKISFFFFLFTKLYVAYLENNYKMLAAKRFVGGKKCQQRTVDDDASTADDDASTAQTEPTATAAGRKYSDGR